MKPGLRKTWQGRKHVLMTHPRSQQLACVLSRQIAIPDDQTTMLRFAVNNHPQGTWTLVVRINDQEVLKKSIETSQWQEVQLDLTKYAGKTVKLELENRASDWAFEAAYWHQLKIGK